MRRYESLPFVADTASLDKARDDLDRWAQEFKRAFEDSIKTLVGKLKELTDEGARVGVSINDAANRAAGASVSLQAAIAAAEARATEIQASLSASLRQQNSAASAFEVTQDDRILAELHELSVLSARILDLLTFMSQNQPVLSGGGGD